MSNFAPITPAARWPIIRERMRTLRQFHRALWVADDGGLRCGHSGDVVTMLDDLRIESRLEARP